MEKSVYSANEVFWWKSLGIVLMLQLVLLRYYQVLCQVGASVELLVSNDH
jgi:hypothetical protein